MADDSIPVLLTKIRGEIELGEERLSNKMDIADFLREKEALKTEFYRAIKVVDDKINSLYWKAAGISGGISGIAAIIKYLN